MTRSPHFKDDRLFECYQAARTGELPDPRVVEHLADCRECTARYADLSQFMDGLRSDAEAEADAIFTAERLQTQAQQITRRLTHIHRPARVISFPARDAAGLSTNGMRVPSRWLAGAAAAGLFIGVAVGGYLGPAGLRTAPPPMQVAAAPAATRVAPQPVRVSAPAEPRDDNAFLEQLDLALASPQLRELRAFDELTPHVREIRSRVR